MGKVNWAGVAGLLFSAAGFLVLCLMASSQSTIAEIFLVDSDGEVLAEVGELGISTSFFSLEVEELEDRDLLLEVADSVPILEEDDDTAEGFGVLNPVQSKVIVQFLPMDEIRAGSLDAAIFLISTDIEGDVVPFLNDIEAQEVNNDCGNFVSEVSEELESYFDFLQIDVLIPLAFQGMTDVFSSRISTDIRGARNLIDFSSPLTNTLIQVLEAAFVLSEPFLALDPGCENINEDTVVDSATVVCVENAFNQVIATTPANGDNITGVFLEESVNSLFPLCESASVTFEDCFQDFANAVGFDIAFGDVVQFDAATIEVTGCELLTQNFCDPLATTMLEYLNIIADLLTEDFGNITDDVGASDGALRGVALVPALLDLGFISLQNTAFEAEESISDIADETNSTLPDFFTDDFDVCVFNQIVVNAGLGESVGAVDGTQTTCTLSEFFASLPAVADFSIIGVFADMLVDVSILYGECEQFISPETNITFCADSFVKSTLSRATLGQVQPDDESFEENVIAVCQEDLDDTDVISAARVKIIISITFSILSAVVALGFLMFNQAPIAFVASSAGSLSVVIVLIVTLAQLRTSSLGEELNQPLNDDDAFTLLFSEGIVLKLLPWNIALMTLALVFFVVAGVVECKKVKEEEQEGEEKEKKDVDVRKDPEEEKDNV